MGKGRQVPALESFTFTDTGITVQLRKVSPLLRDDVDALLRRKFPPPQPPLSRGTEGFGEAKMETNPADPDYQAALLKWQIEHYQRVGDTLLELGIKRYVECEVDQEAVKTLRADMAALGVELDADDKFVFVSRIAIGTRDDLDEFSNALFKRRQLQEAVDAHKATFRGDISGETDSEYPHAQNGAALH